MLIYLLRHGLTAYNAEKRYQGQRDIPLCPAGRAQLRQADLRPETVYITPLCRTRQTAEVLFPGARLVEVKDLQEMCFGSFEGRNFIEMEHDPDYLAWVNANCESPCPDGETKAVFRSGCAGPLPHWWTGPLPMGKRPWSFWPTEAPRWLPWSATPCPMRIITTGAPPMQAAMFWMQEIGRSSGCCTC